MLKQRLEEPGVRLKSQYSSRLYQWAKPYVVVGYKRVSLATLRKILGLEDIKDNSGRVVQEAPLELWANLKQRALDQAPWGNQQAQRHSTGFGISPGGDLIGRYRA
jgi:hypothetical protein